LEKRLEQSKDEALSPLEKRLEQSKDEALSPLGRGLGEGTNQMQLNNHQLKLVVGLPTVNPDKLY
jgi:hypothetical protein